MKVSNIVKLGSLVRFNGFWYLVAQTGLGTVNLINMSSGNRLADDWKFVLQKDGSVLLPPQMQTKVLSSPLLIFEPLFWNLIFEEAFGE